MGLRCAFGYFCGAQHTWVALPNWFKLRLVKEPVLISVADTTALTSAPTLCSAPGPALLVIDRNDLAPAKEHFYLAARTSSLLLDASGRGKVEKLELVTGAEALRDPKGLAVCGRLYFACRPPPPEGESAALKLAREGVLDMGDAGEEEEEDQE